MKTFLGFHQTYLFVSRTLSEATTKKLANFCVPSSQASAV